MVKVGIILGSLRNASRSKLFANNVIELFPEEIETEIIDIGNLPIYNQDFDEDTPEEYTKFRNKMKEIDAVLFITPEHNRTIPAVLKNALDVGSRPLEDSSWNGKPAAIISHSFGNISGFGANHHLRQVLTVLNMPVLQQPEAYLARSATLLDENGKINNEDTLKFLQYFVNSFVDLINRYQN